MKTTVLKPADESEAADIVRSCAGEGRAIRIAGGGTRPIGNPVHADLQLGTGAMSGITLYEPGSLTVVARAGTPLEAVEKALAAEGQQLAFEPADHRGLLGTKGKSTIGGVTAAGVSGPRRIQAGAVRDSLIGVRFVTGEGEIVKNGGRVMKNVTGYDLVKLMAGSHGTLGILTELSFKVLPRPETTASVLVEGLSDADAIATLASALGSPFDISGAAHAPQGPDGGPLTMIRIEGFEKSVSYRAARIRDLLAGSLPAGASVAIETGQARVSPAWRWVRDVEPFHGREGAVWRLSVKPSDGPRIAAELSRQVELQSLYDWGGGLVWLLVPEEEGARADAIRRTVAASGGHATLFRASAGTLESVEAFQPENPLLAAISQRLRDRFDPHGILNPGRMQRRTVNEAA